MTALENRLPPPLVFLGVAALMWAVSSGSDPLDVLGAARWPLVLAFVVVGGVIGPLGFREFARAGTTIDPVHIANAEKLVTTGVFGLTRNPMYLALLCLLTAWAIYLRVPVVWLGPLAFALFITRFQIMPEERVMMEKFGADYAAYQSRVRRWV